MVYNSVIIDVRKRTTQCTLDIIQGEDDSHSLLIKLVDGPAFFDVTGYDIEIEFYDSTTESKVIVPGSVSVINGYRGYLSYVLGQRILQNPARYTVTLKLIRKEGYAESYYSVPNSVLKYNFILNVLKDTTDLSTKTDPKTEVTITKEFYEALEHHLDNRKIHLDGTEHSVLEWLVDNFDIILTADNVIDILSESPEFSSLVRDIMSSDIEELNHEIESKSELLKGFYFDGEFYYDIEHTHRIVPDTHNLYIDLEDSDIMYIWKDGRYSQVSSDSQWTPIVPNQGVK